jgi:hypothetical protein
VKLFGKLAPQPLSVHKFCLQFLSIHNFFFEEQTVQFVQKVKKKRLLISIVINISARDKNKKNNCLVVNFVDEINSTISCEQLF